MKSLHYITIISSITFVIFFFTGCDHKSKEISKEKLQKVSIGLPMQPTVALSIIASEKGFFKDEGLDVTIIAYPSGKRALIEGLLSGKVDVISSAEIPIVMAFLEKYPLQIHASVATADNVNRIVARSDRGIKTATDLAGKKIGTQKASAVHYFLHLFLAHHWINIDSIDLTFMKAEELPEALASGKIDAFSMREPYISQARDLLGDKIIIFDMPGLYIQSELLVSQKLFSRKNPEIVKKLLKSLIRAEMYAKNNKHDSINLVASRLKVDPKIFELQWDQMDLRVRLDQYLLTLLEGQSRWIINNKMIPNEDVPNFLDHLSMDEMIRVKPDAVTIIR